MIARILRPPLFMRVSTATSSRSDARMFTVVVQGYGAASARRAERSISVPFSRLQALMQSISKLGGRIVSVNAASEGSAPAAADATATSSSRRPAPARR
jgi:ferredoxin--NADP+ reductase